MRGTPAEQTHIYTRINKELGGGGGGGVCTGGEGGEGGGVSTDIQCINLLSQPILPLWTNPIMQPHRILSSLSGGPSTQAQPSSQFVRCRKQP